MALEIDPFIGHKIVTSHDSVIRVVRRSRDIPTKYEITCTTCSKDKELFPFPLRMERSHLMNGKLPCGCSRSPKYRKFQYEILCKRKCDYENLTFIGFEGTYEGVSSKIKVYCENHDSITIDSIKTFLSHERTNFCHKCRYDLKKTQEEAKKLRKRFEPSKPCYMYVMEIMDKNTNERFVGVSASNTAEFFKRVSNSKKFKERYEKRLIITRYHHLGQTAINKIDNIRNKFKTIVLDELQLVPFNENSLNFITSLTELNEPYLITYES